MATAARQLVLTLGPGYTGLVGKVTLTVYDLSGAAVLGPTTAGIAEDAALPGTYYAAPSFDSRWAGRVEWTVAGIPGVGGIDDYGASLGASRQIVAALGGDNGGLVGQVGYTVYDTSGAVLIARTTAGIQ